MNLSLLTELDLNHHFILTGMVEEKGDVELNTSSHDEDFSMSVPDDELLHHDSPMLDVDYCDPEDATDHIHNQPVGLGSIICILNMQDTEIPILDEALPLPVWAMPPSPSEEVDEEEEDDIYHMEQTTPTDATMASRSPGMFYDLEEVGPPHMLELKGDPGSIKMLVQSTVRPAELAITFKEVGPSVVRPSCPRFLATFLFRSIFREGFILVSCQQMAYFDLTWDL